MLSYIYSYLTNEKAASGLKPTNDLMESRNLLMGWDQFSGVTMDIMLIGYDSVPADYWKWSNSYKLVFGIRYVPCTLSLNRGHY